jgi:hypothetical protein
MKWKFTKHNEFPNDNETVFCVFDGTSEIKEIVFSKDEFNEYQVKAWVTPEDIYFDFLDKEILDNGVEIIPTKERRSHNGLDKHKG